MNYKQEKRRAAIKKIAFVVGGIAIAPTLISQSLAKPFLASNPILPFQISLSQWAFESEIFGKGRDNYKWFKKMLEEDPQAVLQGSMDTTDIVVKAQKLGLHGVDLVTSMIYGHRNNTKWLRNFKQKGKDHDVSFICLMADTATKIGASDLLARKKAVDDHKHWIEAAVELGCEHIRVNPFGDGTYLQQMNQCSESLYELSEFASNVGMQLTVENHGHPSSNGAWLNMLIELTNHSNLGLFLDFGNFFMGGFNAKPRRWYDLKQGVIDLAPFTVGISGKARSFLPNGDIEMIDYDWNMEQVLASGFNGWVSAEYAGKEYSNTQGAQMIIDKLRKLQEKHKQSRTNLMT
ncbi:sugar phosphate isomerase/epimerase family protein [Colwellia psychrerythraea]|uniref:Xylose isomerase-like TIM barrel domain-containing protein n=1 Tax=Colwellia psychrerythraea (strain 34H / ATCC BAA-681) TaxID=167879 RepID=Q482C8_COLP3|nr:sugar phosphate isomerase/epimerase family protein [Colwellia psychrerythraea]AAZ27489.1 hypothetical protein CPS_2372 [Colwellia psychrerythraea 34H]